ncbi:MAG: ABC transporter permease [Cyclobacteriaceae bacterium]|nr:ABC transporter permease [Cyclobacteriaceae bacterium]
MIFNFLKIMLRNLWKNPVTSAINLLGFSLGIAIAALMFSYVYQELNYEEYHPLADRIYKVELHLTIDGEDKVMSVSPNILGPRLKETCPEVESYVRMHFPINSTAILIVENEHFKEPAFYAADSTIFDIFHFEILHGSTDGLLSKPEDAMISENTAVRLFGEPNAVGLTYRDPHGKDYVIKAVYRDHPESSHFRPNVIASALSGQLGGELIWDQSNYYTYLLLNKNTDKAALDKKIADIVGEEGPEWMNRMNVAFRTIPIRDIHLGSKADFQAMPHGDINQVYASIIIAVFILVIACVNYINLTTSRSLERAREVGLRKMMGGFRRQLIFQFLLESLFITLLSFVLAVVIVSLVRPYFSQLVESNISFAYLFEFTWILYVISAWLLLSILAGIYPAVIITSFEPYHVLKGSFKKSRMGTAARKSLVIFQFVISTSLIIGTFIVFKQLSFMNETELGFDKEHTLAVTMNRVPEENILSSLKKNYQQHNNIHAVSFSSAYPSRNSGGQILRGEDMAEDEHFLAWEWRVDEDILDAFGLKLVSGRKFMEKSDESSGKEYLINQTAMKMLGWNEENALGRKVFISGEEGLCIGIVKDFHYASLRDEVAPLVLNLQSSYRNNIIIRLGDGDLRSTMAFIEAEWKKHNPGIIFDYQFIEESFDRLYKNETRTARMFTGFSFLAIIIASLGLFGLSTYETQMRTKEIGIRKAMGSSDIGILQLLIRKFTWLILVSFIISVPVSYLLMDQWLEGFAYRISMGMPEFIIAGLIIMSVVFISVGYRSLMAAVQNPAKSLRYE